MADFQLRDIPKFYGFKDDDPHCHLAEFKDFLSVTLAINLKEIEKMDKTESVIRIIDLFSFSLKDRAKYWFCSKYEELTDGEKTVEIWNKIRKEFETNFCLIGSSQEEREMALRNLKWQPSKQSFDDFLMHFRAVLKTIGGDESKQLVYFVMAMPLQFYTLLSIEKDLSGAIEAVKKAIGIGLLNPDEKLTNSLGSNGASSTDSNNSDSGQATLQTLQTVKDSSLGCQDQNDQDQDYYDENQYEVDQYNQYEADQNDQYNQYEADQNDQYDQYEADQNGQYDQYEDDQEGYDLAAQTVDWEQCEYCNKTSHPIEQCWHLQECLWNRGFEMKQIQCD